jgi:hypothetical protein
MKLSKVSIFFLFIFFLFFMVSCDGSPTGLTGIESSDLDTITDLLTTQTSDEGTQIVTTKPVTSTDQETSGVETTTEPEPKTTVEQTTTARPTSTEGPTTNTPTHRIYFLNSVGWESVYAYAWIGEEQHLGPMPGTLATQETDSDWWYVDVQVNFDVDELGLIFNNGDLDNLLQTPDVMLDSPFYLYVTITGESFVTKTLAEDSFVSNRVWFYNSDNWDQVNAYAWVGSSRILGNFPGQPATQEAETDWWYVDLPYDFSEIPVNIIFNENENIKTADILLEDNIHVYVSVDSMVFDSKEALENSLVQTTIWFYNSEAWDEVYIKGRIMRQIIDDEIIYEAIPNTLANQEGDSNWWSFKLPVDASVYNTEVIFNNGNDIETSYIMIDTNANAFVTFSGEVFSSKELAIDSLDLASTTVYFYNSEGWTNINAYVFGDSGEVLGPWQGSPALEDTENPHWWMIEVPLDASVNPFKIIFNNEDGSLQSGEALIEGQEAVYVSLTGGPYTTRELAIESLNVSSTLYFYNSEGWSQVYAYVFGTSGNFLGLWDETLANQEGDSYWWMVEVPVDIENSSFMIVFHNNQDYQTPDIIMDFDSRQYITLDGNLYGTKNEAEEAITSPVSTTIHFLNSEEWENVFATVTDENDNPILTDSQANQEIDSNWWYIEVDLDTSVSPITISFSNGLSEIIPLVTIDDLINVFVTINGDTFETKEDAEASLISTENTTIYFYNSQGWLSVHAYVFGDYGEVLGAWNESQLATQDTIDTDWWMVDVPLDASMQPFNIIFSNQDRLVQSGETLINNTESLYVSITGQAFSSKQMVIDSLLSSTTLYFYNSVGWSEVHAYVFGDAGELLGSWEESQAAREDTEDLGWWLIDVPVDTLNTPIYIIFHNNNNGMQTQNYFIDNATNIYLVPSGGKYADKASAESNLETTTRIYFYNPIEVDWDVSAHMWLYIGTNPDLNTNWPGTSLIQWFVDDDNNPETPDIATDWWYVDVSTTTSSWMMVLSDSGGTQTKDLVVYAYDEVFIELNELDSQDGKYTVNMYFSLEDVGSAVPIE